MTETVVPSLEARIQDLARTARQQMAPGRAGPAAAGLPGVPAGGADAQAEPVPALSPGAAPEPAAPRAAPGPLPADLRDPAHPGHAAFKRSLREVHYMEAGQDIASGPHSQKVAAGLLVAAEREGQRLTNVSMGADGQVQGLQGFSAFDTPKTVRIDPRQAQSVEMQDYARQWTHLLGQAPPAERTAAQAQGIAALSAADRAMFARIRQDVPAHIGDDHIAQAMLNAKREGVAEAGKIDRVQMAGEKVWVSGTTPGLRAATDVSQQAAPMHDTVQQAQALDQQRERQVAWRRSSGRTARVAAAARSWGEAGLAAAGGSMRAVGNGCFACIACRRRRAPRSCATAAADRGRGRGACGATGLAPRAPHHV
ncbi:XVIPCD domain-containing protein [Xanthomonas theicola]|uniref:XVIPCD domain-containing protein n=1 Tax=Xanthomonas theicola TaxID=56464 RepID=UPI003611ABDD